MKIKKIEYDFSVCKVADYSEVNAEAEYCLREKRMKKTHWYALRQTCHPIHWSGMTAGRPAAFRESWIFPWLAFFLKLWKS